MRSMASSLILHGRIKTTEAKAKNLKPFVEKMITRAKKGSPAMRELRKNFSLGVTKKFIEVAARYSDRKGGYTRIIKLGQRRSDASHMVYIELV